MIENIQLQVPFVDLKAQYATIKDEVQAAFAEVFETASFILGDAVQRFETNYANYCGAKYAVGVDTGISALELLLRAYDIGDGDEVITVANTFIATALAISSAGATPVLVDIDPLTYNIDPTAVEAAITPCTKAIMPVHLYGQPVEMNTLLSIANRHGLILIEDACQAHGATYHGQRVGSIAHGAAFSFYPAKNLGAYGDGGMVTTNDAQIADKIRVMRDYGQRKKYHHEVVGYNRRLDTLQAAALNVKLNYLDQWNAARRDHAENYNRLLAGASAITPSVLEDVEPVWHLYVIRSEDRDSLRAYLADHGISTGVHYPVPVHLHEAYQWMGYKEGDFPISEKYAEHILSLPIYAEMSQDQVIWVAEAIELFEGAR